MPPAWPRRIFTTALREPLAGRSDDLRVNWIYVRNSRRWRLIYTEIYKMKTKFFAALVVSTFVLVSGCQEAPEAELDAARAALMQADSAEADVYASDLFVAALDSFNAAQSEIEVQDAKSGMGRDYAHAEELLAFTQQAAQDALGQVEVNKEALRVEADSLIAIAQSALATQPAPTANTVADSGTETIATLINDAVLAREMGDYKSARDLARTAVEQLGQAPTPAESIIPRS